MKQHCATLKSGCFNLAKRWCNVVSTSDTVLTLWNVENPTSDSVSFSTSHQLYFNVDQQHWKNVDLTLKLWLGSSIALKFETTVFLGLKRDFRVFRNSFGLPTLSESSSSENTYFFASIKCFALNLAFFILFFIDMKPRFLERLEKFVLWPKFFEYFSIKPILSIPIDSLNLRGWILSMTVIIFSKKSKSTWLTSSKYS